MTGNMDKAVEAAANALCENEHLYGFCRRDFGVCANLPCNCRELARAVLTAALPHLGAQREEIVRENIQNGWAALRMIREAIETLGPVGALPSEEAVLGLYGPEPVHEATAIVEALRSIIPTSRGQAWMPIETAPENGAVIDVWSMDWDGTRENTIGNGRRTCEVSWSHGDWRTRDGGRIESNGCYAGHYYGHRATHWMPLPSPPADSEGKL